MKYLLALLLLTGCAVAPQSIDQRIAYGVGSVTAMRGTCADLAVRQRITKQAAQDCLIQTDQAKLALDVARGASLTGDMSTAQAQLNAAQAALTRLEAELKGKQ